MVLQWFGNGLRVVAAGEQYQPILGDKLVGIDNVPVQEIADDIDTLISHENDQWLRAKNISFFTIPEVLRYFKIITGNRGVRDRRD